MDNFHIDIVCKGKDVLAKALDIAFAGKGYSTARVTHYAITPEKGLILMDCRYGKPSNPAAVALPFTLDPQGAADFAHRWLQETADYGREPDHDGDNSKGWRVYTEGWGMIGSDYHAFVAIKPEWAMHGK